MIMSPKKSISLVFPLVLLGTLATVSCSKFLDVKRPIDQVTTKSVFADSSSAAAAVDGLYLSLMINSLGFLNGKMTIDAGLSADEIRLSTISSTPNPFETNTLLSTTGEISSLWAEAYKDIYHANSIIQNVTSSTLSDPTKWRLVGEMKGMRALLYFYLANLYGGVPLPVATDFRANAPIARSSMDDVFKQIVADLKDAKELLSSGSVSFENTRMNKWAVSALLARVYLFQHDWANAVAESSSIINSGLFSLPKLEAVFVKGSNEAIFQMQPSSLFGFNASEGYYFIPSSPTTLPTYSLRAGLLDAFENGDQRKLAWIGSSKIGTTTYYYPYKYKVRSNADYSSKSEYNIVLRLAELYLVRAEAQAALGNMPAALADVNKVRNRAGLAELEGVLPNISQRDLLRQIYHEKQIEFFAEWGHRWFDLRRTGLANVVLGAVKGDNWQAFDQLYPIPESELLSNSKLTQNEGY